MPARGLLGHKAPRRVLRTDITQLDFYERITLLEKTNVIACDLAAPSVNEIELAFFSGAVLELLRTLIGGQFGQLAVELLRRWFGGKANLRKRACDEADH